ncbi:MAG: fumarylacetoacetate hydrolase family protein [Candidatus Baltobacteraceae bacterium]|jgi:2-keto-4-pentenoate hydratase/2-oxohepta-3-ene-1,7-dioic acid hydratase in catechol pathway
MRYVSFLAGGLPRGGILRDDGIHPFAGVPTLLDYIRLSAAERAAVAEEAPVPLSAATLLAPVRPHKNVFCVGRNYMGHAEEIARARNVPLNLPNVPTFFTKAPTAIADPGATLALSPEVSSQYDFEAELAVVIGERCRDVPESRALEVVFGYTALNDVTARDLQKEHHQWFKGKSLDQTCPIGPWIVGADEISDPQQLDIALTVNGVTKQSSNTSQMIFTVAAIVASLSRGMTLEPGDVIATGTPDGVGMARTPPEFLQDGDLLEVEIPRVGVLRNRISLAVPVRA